MLATTASRFCSFPRMTITATCVALFLSACASSPLKSDSVATRLNAETGEFEDIFVSDFPLVTQDQIALTSETDVFKIGDTAEVNVYNVDSLTGEYVIDRSGNVDFPLIGKVKVSGLSTLDLQEELVELYGAKYLRNPGISVKIDSKELGRIVVDGAVNRPGVFEVKQIVRLTEAVALAEGLGEDANSKEVFIVRTIDGKRHVKSVNLKAVRTAGLADPQIIPNDVVFVQDSRGRVLFREFLRTIPLLNTALIYSRR